MVAPRDENWVSMKIHKMTVPCETPRLLGETLEENRKRPKAQVKRLSKNNLLSRCEGFFRTSAKIPKKLLKYERQECVGINRLKMAGKY